MGCCKTKIDENAGINYEEDEIPRFDIQKPFNDNNAIKAKSGVSMNSVEKETSFGPSEAVNSKTTISVAQPSKFNKFNEDVVREQPSDNNYNGMKLNNATSFGAIPEEYTKNLFLTIKESKFNQLGKVLEITPTGLKGSTRNSEDGIVYFGLHSLDFKNDFCFKAEEGVNKQHMEIKFEKDSKTGYYVKNLNGSGVFIKIDDYLTLKDQIIISFGTNHLLVTILNTQQNQRDMSTIKFKAIYGPNKNED